jgi:hypothetical protein
LTARPAGTHGVCEPGEICLSEDAYRQVKGRLDLAITDLGPTQLKNIAEPVRVYALKVGLNAQAKPAKRADPATPKKRTTLTLLFPAIVALLILIAGGVGYLLSANRRKNPLRSGLWLPDRSGSRSMPRRGQSERRAPDRKCPVSPLKANP